MKRGVNTLLFTYIFAALVLGFILFFGIRAIVDTVSFAKTVDVASFEKRLSHEVGDIYSYAPGSATKVSLAFPATALCVVTSGKTSYEQVNEYYAVVGSSRNVFYVTENDDPPEPFFVEKLVALHGNQCVVSQQGKATFVLKNEGDHVVFSLP